MIDPGVTRVAVYIDFDNIVISRYDQIHGRNQFHADRSRAAGGSREGEGEFAAKRALATVDIGAVIDYASSFGTLALTRAYADWSLQVNADYRRQLVNRSVELVQLFPAAAYAKNGADIRLAVDAVEDMFRLPDLTHVVIVAGDSDYVPLAQRCKRLNRYVVGVGVAGSTAKSLSSACDDFEYYDRLPGITAAESRSASVGPAPAQPAEVTDAQVEERLTTRAARKLAPSLQPFEQPVAPPAQQAPAKKTAKKTTAEKTTAKKTTAKKTTAKKTTAKKTATQKSVARAVDPDDPQELATRLLERALRLGHAKNDEDWLFSGTVKTQMKRMDPSFSEKGLGYRSFSDFVKSRDGVAELDEKDQTRKVRLSPLLAAKG